MLNVFCLYSILKFFSIVHTFDTLAEKIIFSKQGLKNNVKEKEKLEVESQYIVSVVSMYSVVMILAEEQGKRETKKK